jgi:hypothetical protein
MKKEHCNDANPVGVPRAGATRAAMPWGVVCLIAFWLVPAAAQNSPVAAADPTPPRNIGNAGVVGKGPVIDEFSFEGNIKASSAELARIVQIMPGVPLSSMLVQPELERITAWYKDRGSAYVQPSILEKSLNHVRVIFQIHEGKQWMSAGSVPQPAPAFMEPYWGNTMVCAAAQTSNDLCHMWLMKNGRFIIFDPNGVHPGTWEAGKVMADGRVPICRHWEGQTVQLPPEIVAAKNGGAAPGGAPGPANAAPGGAPARAGGPAGAPGGAMPGAGAGAGGGMRGARLCKIIDFQMQCTAYPDVTQLDADQKRIASLGMVERNKEVGSCYSHGPHKVGDVWFEWDDYAPGQLGLDRQMLLPGHQ